MLKPLKKYTITFTEEDFINWMCDIIDVDWDFNKLIDWCYNTDLDALDLHEWMIINRVNWDYKDLFNKALEKIKLEASK